MITPETHGVFSITIWKGKTGEYIGRCNELKGIIVHGKTPTKLWKCFEQAVKAYFEAFPEEED